MSRLQAWLVEQVDRSGYTQAALAEKVGISEKHMSQIMTGRAEGSLSLWSNIISVIGWPLPEIGGITLGTTQGAER